MSIFPTKILLATDGSREADLAASTAVGLAQETASELHVVHVLILPLNSAHDPYSFDTEARERSEKRARERLEGLVGGIEASGGTVEASHLRVGRPDAEIVGLAEEISAGLIVVGSRGFGAVRRVLTGSVSDSVVHHAHCPVVVVRGEPAAFPTRVLVATDGSEEAELAASTAADLAGGTGSELHVVYVEPLTYAYQLADWETYDADFPTRLDEAAEKEASARLDELTGKMSEAGAEIAGAHARVGYPDAEIVALAGKLGAGLIVLGSRGFGSLKRALMGSVSSSVVHHAHCPVLVARSRNR
jgi:nucleotide-binding universal stress UspA family protein